MFIKDCSFKYLFLSGCKAVQLQAAELTLDGFTAEKSDLTLACFNLSNLSGANMSQITLAGAFFCGARLTGANLSGSDLSRAIFSSADLTAADLSAVSGSYADFSGANLTEAKLKTADFRNINAHLLIGLDVNAESADLTGSLPTDEALARAESFKPWDTQ
jgi:uncharacterized protein YjbI with pentapeptide repeats